MGDYSFEAGVIITALVIGIIGGLMLDALSNQNNQLGNAICSQTTGTKYISYSDGVVQCEKRTDTYQYDGIKVVGVPRDR